MRRTCYGTDMLWDGRARGQTCKGIDVQGDKACYSLWDRRVRGQTCLTNLL